MVWASGCRARSNMCHSVEFCAGRWADVLDRVEGSTQLPDAGRLADAASVVSVVAGPSLTLFAADSRSGSARYARFSLDRLQQKRFR